MMWHRMSSIGAISAALGAGCVAGGADTAVVPRADDTPSASMEAPVFITPGDLTGVLVTMDIPTAFDRPTMAAPDAPAADAGTLDVGLDVGTEVAPLDAGIDVPPIDVAPLDAGIDVPALDVRTDVGPADAISRPEVVSADVPRDIVAVDVRACPSGQALCPTTPFMSEPASSFRCTATIAGRCPGADLVIRGEWIADDTDGNVLALSAPRFDATAAEVAEGCVSAAGLRRLLHFNFAVLNVGNSRFNVGRPDERDTVHWEFFTPHRHFHIKGWGDYRLRTLAGREVGHGRKQSFCLEDNIRQEGAREEDREFAPPRCELFDPGGPPEYRPEFGLSVGWGDEYPSGIRCQWIDIGSPDPSAADHLANGIYVLAITVNTGDTTATPLYRELDYSNNAASIRVEIEDATVRACVGTAGDACAGGRVRCDGSCGP
jgi:hypothetical protein